MKECDIFRRVKTYRDPSYIFSGGHDPLPRIYAPVQDKCAVCDWFEVVSNWYNAMKFVSSDTNWNVKLTGGV